MPDSYSHGPTPQANSRRLFVAILRFSLEMMDEPSVKSIKKKGLNFSWTKWDCTEPTLEIKGTVKLLKELVLADQPGLAPLSSADIGQILNHYLGDDHLGILKHHLPVGPGKVKRHFTLKLWSLELDVNLKQFDRAWADAHPTQSKATEPDPSQKPLVLSNLGQKESCKFSQAPALPANFVPRPEHQTAIKTLLLSDEEDQLNTLVVVALSGLGGIGKSVLAMAVANDPDIQSRFTDGILWATLGQNPDVLSILSGWIQALGDYKYKPLTLEAASAHLRTMLSTVEKGILLVVDDLWESQHFEHFRVGNAKCRVLVTTREAVISGKTNRYEMDVMTSEQSLELLNRSLKESITDSDLEDVEVLTKEVGYLPLALELLAARRNEKLSWSRLRSEFEQEYNRRFRILKHTNAESQGDSEHIKNLVLEVSFSLSLQRLRETHPNIYEAFLWFGVLPDDVLITEKMTTTLWHCSSWDAGEKLRTLKAKSLLQDGKTQGGFPSYRLHDLVHDYARQLMTAPKEAELITDIQLPGLGLSLINAQRQFLERYHNQTKSGFWHTLPDDDYIHGHLSWHFIQAQKSEWLHQLLKETTDAGKNGWHDTCDSLGQPAYFITDVGRAWDLAEKALADVSLTIENRGELIGLLCRYMLITTSLHSLAKIPKELLLALVSEGFWTPYQGLACTRQNMEPVVKAECLTKISSYVPIIRHTLLKEVLEDIKQIQDEKMQAKAIQAVVDDFPDNLLTELIVISRKIQNKIARIIALTAISQRIPEAIAEALEVARKIQRNDISFSEHDSITDFFESLTEEFSEEALIVASQLSKEYRFSKPLVALMGKIPQKLLPKALESIHQIGSPSDQTLALVALAKRFFEVVPKALNSIYQYDCWEFSHLPNPFISLLDMLPDELLVDALTVARQIPLLTSQSKSLAALAKRLPEVLPEALAVVDRIHGWEDEHENAFLEVAVELSAQIPADILPKVTSTISRIINSSSPFESELTRLVLPMLIDSFGDQLLTDVIELTRSINNPGLRSELLMLLSKRTRQKKEFLQEALESARCIKDSRSRSSTLTTLGNTLPEVLPEALSAAIQIQDARYILEVKVSLTEYDSEFCLEVFDLFTQALGKENYLNENYNITQFIKLLERTPDELITEFFPNIQKILFIYRSKKDRDFNYQEEKSLLLIFKILGSKAPKKILPIILEESKKDISDALRLKLLAFLFNRLPENYLLGFLKDRFFEKNRKFSEFGNEDLSNLFENASDQFILEIFKIAYKKYDDEDFWRCILHTAIEREIIEVQSNAVEILTKIDHGLSRILILIEFLDTYPMFLDEILEFVGVLSERYEDEYADQLIGQVSAHNQLKILEVLVVKLPDEKMFNTVSILRMIQWEDVLAKAIGLLSDRLSEDLLPEVLEIALAIKEDVPRIEALIVLVKRFPERILDLVTTIEGMEDSFPFLVPAWLVVLTYQLSSSHPEEALELAYAIKDRPLPYELPLMYHHLDLFVIRAEAFIQLLGKFPEILTDTLEILQDRCLSIREHHWRSLANQITDKKLQDVLSAIDPVENPRALSDALQAFASKFSDEELFTALRHARHIQGKYQYPLVMTSLIQEGCRIKSEEKSLSYLQEFLRELSSDDRPSSLDVLASSIDLINRLGGKTALASVNQALDQVCKWWP